MGVPVSVAASSDKIRPAGGRAVADVGDQSAQTAPAGAVYEGDADLPVHAPTFEVVPFDLVDGVVTEIGVLDADGIRAVAERHADNAARVDHSE